MFMTATRSGASTGKFGRICRLNLRDGRLHPVDGDHVDEHTLAVDGAKLGACTPDHSGRTSTLSGIPAPDDPC